MQYDKLTSDARFLGIWYICPCTIKHNTIIINLIVVKKDSATTSTWHAINEAINKTDSNAFPDYRNYSNISTPLEFRPLSFYQNHNYFFVLLNFDHLNLKINEFFKHIKLMIIKLPINLLLLTILIPFSTILVQKWLRRLIQMMMNLSDRF